MQYEQAFNSLGYSLISVRNDWTAEKYDGVCVTIWKRELDWKSMVMDSQIHGGDIAGWGHKQGNARRILHATRALAEFDGWVDAILISGQPGISYEDAQPWIPADKGGKRWRVTFLDSSTGHIRFELQN